MATTAIRGSPIPPRKGFEKWVKLSLDDLPLIKPPKHHMVVQMTGGLTNLYKKLALERKTAFPDEPIVPEKSEDQIELEKSDIIKIPLVKFFTDQKASKDAKEKEDEAIKDEDSKNSGEDDSLGKEKKTEGAEVNGEEEAMDTDKENKEVIKEEIPKNISSKSKESEKKDADTTEKIDDEGGGADEVKKVKLVENGDADSSSEKDNASNSVEAKEKTKVEETEPSEKGEETSKKTDETDSKMSKEKDSSEKEQSDKDKENSTENVAKKAAEVNMDESVEEVKCDPSSDDVQQVDKEKDSGEELDSEDEEEETTEYTDEDGEFVPRVGMPLLAGRYNYLQVLGRGQSALIIKAEDTFCENRPLAIKILHRVYKPIGSQEADILLELHRADPYLHVPFARIRTQFLYGPHYCLVFDCLSPTSLYTHYDQRDIRGATAIPYIRQLAVKLLTVMGFLQKQNVIHADLKPENILLAKENDLNSIMVVDFGNALRNTEEELSLYYSDFELQTLLYRAPEVIFGLHFSLEVDMWSLGCLLAECYIGKPLFMGKTKHDILAKISKLLGPFPKEFSEGECAEEFSQFIGRPLSRYQRMQNLAKRLNKCTDVHFLMLIEKMLTYLPDRRTVPSEAACHPFVAYISPFLYLTPTPGMARYPTVVLDLTTYPFLPEAVDEETASVDGGQETKTARESRMRLLSYAPPVKASSPVSSASITNNNSMITTTSADGTTLMSINKQTKTVSVTNVSTSGGNSNSFPADGGVVGSSATGGQVNNSSSGPEASAASRADVKETLKSMGLRCEDFTISVYSKEQAHAILRRQGVQVTNQQQQFNAADVAVSGNNRQQFSSRQQQQQYNQMRYNNSANSSSRSPRSNNNNNNNNNSSSGRAQQQQAPPSNRGSGRSAAKPPTAASTDDDDDDCVILDPPPPVRPTSGGTSRGAPVPPKQPPHLLPPPPSSRLPQQFQLMGTTVQVNRSGSGGQKRPFSGPQSNVSSKRQHRQQQQQQQQGGYPNYTQQQLQQQRYMYQQQRLQQQQHSSSSRSRQQPQRYQPPHPQYSDDFSDEDSEGGEASVQDTLKRLKNYNISITCRRNEQQANAASSRQMMASGSGMRGANMRQQQQRNRQQQPQFQQQQQQQTRRGRQQQFQQSQQQMQQQQQYHRQQQVLHRNNQGQQYRGGSSEDDFALEDSEEDDHHNMMLHHRNNMMSHNDPEEHMDMEDEDMEDNPGAEDMAKFLECEIGEEGDPPLGSSANFEYDEDEEIQYREKHNNQQVKRGKNGGSNNSKNNGRNKSQQRNNSAVNRKRPVEDADTSVEEVVTLSRDSDVEEQAHREDYGDKDGEELDEDEGDNKSKPDDEASEGENEELADGKGDNYGNSKNNKTAKKKASKAEELVDNLLLEEKEDQGETTPEENDDIDDEPTRRDKTQKKNVNSKDKKQASPQQQDAECDNEDDQDPAETKESDALAAAEEEQDPLSDDRPVETENGESKEELDSGTTARGGSKGPTEGEEEDDEEIDEELEKELLAAAEEDQ